MKVVAYNTKRLRKKTGLSQEAFALRAGISSIKMIEAGRVGNPRLSTMEAIAKVAGARVVDLYRAIPARKRKAS